MAIHRSPSVEFGAYEEDSCQVSSWLKEPDITLTKRENAERQRGAQHFREDKSVQERLIPETSPDLKMSWRYKGSGPAFNMHRRICFTVIFFLLLMQNKISSVEVERAPVVVHIPPCLVHWTSELYSRCRRHPYCSRMAGNQTLTANTNGDGKRSVVMLWTYSADMKGEAKERLNMTCSGEKAEVPDTAPSFISKDQTNVTTKSTANVSAETTSRRRRVDESIAQSRILGMLCLFTHCTNSTERHRHLNRTASDAAGYFYNAWGLGLLLLMMLTTPSIQRRRLALHVLLTTRLLLVLSIHSTDSTEKADTKRSSFAVEDQNDTTAFIMVLMRSVAYFVLFVQLVKQYREENMYMTENRQFNGSTTAPGKQSTRESVPKYKTNCTESPVSEIRYAEKCIETTEIKQTAKIDNIVECMKNFDLSDTDKCFATGDENGIKLQRTTDIGSTDEENTFKHRETTDNENTEKDHVTLDFGANGDTSDKIHSGASEISQVATAARTTAKWHRGADIANKENVRGRNDSGNTLHYHGVSDTGNAGKCQEKEDKKTTAKWNRSTEHRNVEPFFEIADYGENGEFTRTLAAGNLRKHSYYTSLQTETGDEIKENEESHEAVVNENTRKPDTNFSNEHGGESSNDASYDADETNKIEGLGKTTHNTSNEKVRESIQHLELRSIDSKEISTSTSYTNSSSDVQNVTEPTGARLLHDSVGMRANMIFVYQNIKEDVSVINTISASISSVGNQNEDSADKYGHSKMEEDEETEDEDETILKTVFVDTLNEFTDLDNNLLYNQSDESDEESLDEYVAQMDECCVSGTTDIPDNVCSSSITTSGEIPEKRPQEQRCCDKRKEEIKEYVSCFFESEEEDKRPAKTLDSFPDCCNLRKTHNRNGQGNDAISLHGKDVNTEQEIRTRSTTNSGITLKKRKKVIPTFYERRVRIALSVTNHFFIHNQPQNVFLIQRLRAATLITQDLSNLWGRVIPAHDDRNERQVFNRSPNVETDEYEDQDSGATGYSDTGRRSHDNEITEITSDVFYKICTSSVTESMRFEWARFKSFWSFPMDCPALPTSLAKYGFYYTGNRDEVVCFSCHISHSNWNRGDSVYAMHYQISRRCRFMNGENVGNVPIHGPWSCLSRRAGGGDGASGGSKDETKMRSMISTPETVTSLFLGQDPANQVVGQQREQPLSQVRKDPNENGDIPQVNSNQMETRNSTECGGGSHFSGFQATASSGSASISQAAAMSPTNTVTMSRPGQTPSALQSARLHTHEHTTTQTSMVPHTAAPNTDTQAASRLLTGNNAPPTTNQGVAAPTGNRAQAGQNGNQQQALNQQHPTTSDQRHQQRRLDQQDQREQPQQDQSQISPANVNGAARNQNNLGVTRAKPRYPNYAVMAVRSGTFNGFPNHLDQTPLQMAKAGFFYAGYGDYVRCFFCGGGLRNWEAGDDPWVEHARWFPRCAYVKQNRGQTFINLVLQRQRELALPNEYINTTREAVNLNSVETSQAQTARRQDNTERQSTVSNAQNRSNTQTGSSTNTSSSTASVSNLPSLETEQVVTQAAASTDVMNSPAVLSVKNMGYDDRIIQAAIQCLRNIHGPVELTATRLLEILFGMEDTPLETIGQTQAGSHHAEGSATKSGSSSIHKGEPSNAENKAEEPQLAAAAASQQLIPKTKLKGDKAANSYTEEELKSIQEENNQLKEQMKCKICMDNVVCISFLPCGHLCCCAECAPAMVKCPICRQIVRGSVKTYLS